MSIFLKSELVNARAVIKEYEMMCEALGVKPTFEGLKATVEREQNGPRVDGYGQYSSLK